MNNFFTRLFLNQWQRKVVAFVCAVIVWAFVNYSITDTKTMTNIPVRIINIPKGMTIPSIFPNGMLKKRLTLTLSGSKDVIQELEPGDFEVLLDASTNDHEDWIVNITKKNLVSLNPSIDLLRHITQVSHSEFVLKLRPIVKLEVPVDILPSPLQESPKGYTFLDIWPNELLQSIESSQGELFPYQSSYVELCIPLENVSKEDLDALSANELIVNFLVPLAWKEISLPDRPGKELLNDPRAEHLTMSFLRNTPLPLKQPVPIQIFYLSHTLNELNPKTHPLKKDDYIKNEKGMDLLTLPLFVFGVDQTFLDCIQDHLAISIVAEKKSRFVPLDWSVQVINSNEMEDKYVRLSLEKDAVDKGENSKERLYRQRFQKFLKTLTLFAIPGHPLRIEAFLEDNQIVIKSFY